MTESKPIRVRKDTQDLTGKQFGRLSVIGISHRQYYPSGQSQLMWSCRCGCGETARVTAHHLTSDAIASCGCLARDRTIEAHTTHGMSKSSEYVSWRCMMKRCYSPNHGAYPLYGGRGIAVCPQWHSFERFHLDMGTKPSPRMEIDRIDNSKGYEPGNCRWVTETEQTRNRANSRYVTLEARTLHLKEWEEISGIDAEVIWVRIHKLGWNAQKALTTPVKKQRSRAK